MVTGIDQVDSGGGVFQFGHSVDVGARPRDGRVTGGITPNTGGRVAHPHRRLYVEDPTLEVR